MPRHLMIKRSTNERRTPCDVISNFTESVPAAYSSTDSKLLYCSDVTEAFSFNESAHSCQSESDSVKVTNQRMRPTRVQSPTYLSFRGLKWKLKHEDIFANSNENEENRPVVAADRLLCDAGDNKSVKGTFCSPDRGSENLPHIDTFTHRSQDVLGRWQLTDCKSKHLHGNAIHIISPVHGTNVLFTNVNNENSTHSSSGSKINEFGHDNMKSGTVSTQVEVENCRDDSNTHQESSPKLNNICKNEMMTTLYKSQAIPETRYPRHSPTHSSSSTFCAEFKKASSRNPKTVTFLIDHDKENRPPPAVFTNIQSSFVNEEQTQGISGSRTISGAALCSYTKSASPNEYTEKLKRSSPKNTRNITRWPQSSPRKTAKIIFPRSGDGQLCGRTVAENNTSLQLGGTSRLTNDQSICEGLAQSRTAPWTGQVKDDSNHLGARSVPHNGGHDHSSTATGISVFSPVLPTTTSATDTVVTINTTTTTTTITTTTIGSESNPLITIFNNDCQRKPSLNNTDNTKETLTPKTSKYNFDASMKHDSIENLFYAQRKSEPTTEVVWSDPDHRNSVVRDASLKTALREISQFPEYLQSRGPITSFLPWRPWSERDPSCTSTASGHQLCGQHEQTLWLQGTHSASLPSGKVLPSLEVNESHPIREDQPLDLSFRNDMPSPPLDLRPEKSPTPTTSLSPQTTSWELPPQIDTLSIPSGYPSPILSVSDSLATPQVLHIDTPTPTQYLRQNTSRRSSEHVDSEVPKVSNLCGSHPREIFSGGQYFPVEKRSPRSSESLTCTDRAAASRADSTARPQTRVKLEDETVPRGSTTTVTEGHDLVATTITGHQPSYNPPQGSSYANLLLLPPTSQPLPQDLFCKDRKRSTISSSERVLNEVRDPKRKCRDRPPLWGLEMPERSVRFQASEDRQRFCDTAFKYQVPDVPASHEGQSELREALLRLFAKSDLPPVPASLSRDVKGLRFFPLMQTLFQASLVTDIGKLRMAKEGLAFENFQIESDEKKLNIILDTMLEKRDDGAYHCLSRKYIDPAEVTCTFMADNIGKMRRHVKNHLPQKKWVCCFCRVQMTDQTDMERHGSTHTRLRPFRCMECHKPFTQKVTLINHLKTAHGTHVNIDSNRDRYTCRQCGVYYSAEQRQDCIEHLRVYHFDTEFQMLQKRKRFPFNAERQDKENEPGKQGD